MCIMPSGVLSKHILRYQHWAISGEWSYELWFKKTLKDCFLNSLLLCLGTNESRRIAEFWQCSQGASSAPVIIYLFCISNIPSASLHSLLSALIAFSPTAAVKVQFFFKYFLNILKCIFLLSKLILSSASILLPDLILFPLFIHLALLGSLSAGTIVWTIWVSTNKSH